MGGEGIAAARGWEGDVRAGSAIRHAVPLESGAAIGKELPYRAAGLAGLAAGQQRHVGRHEVCLDAARGRHRRGQFIDLNRAESISGRDLYGGADGEVEFHC